MYSSAARQCPENCLSERNLGNLLPSAPWGLEGYILLDGVEVALGIFCGSRSCGLNNAPVGEGVLNIKCL